MPMKWYVVHTYSGHENKAKLSLLERVRQALGLNDKFGDILIPTETVVELVKGQKRSTTRKFFPGYMFVADGARPRRRSTWSRTRPRSPASSAAPTRSRSRRREIAEHQRRDDRGRDASRSRASRSRRARTVRVIDGPFANFTGTVEEVKAEKQKIASTCRSSAARRRSSSISRRSRKLVTLAGSVQ